jgi:lipopolysaccharide transport system ATP-binding protein
MGDAIISVENLGKKYRIQHQAEGRRYVALRDVIAEKAKGFFKKLKSGNSENLKSGNNVSVSAFQRSSVSSSEDFWALKDVSFEVKQGEVVGIIGRNGAGKSTLLKILSRITEPTEGRVRILGRVASLLEVGTGFHPELTGRENIFLNGAILGMHRAEIKRKFDEIVAFAEVEKFLDTPVKRYSSGMYVRLAFAVAAHLEPEILIVDEVLAVGDAEFQKKCLGKMQDVASGGRTVLFVSHNMAAVQTLCGRGILLDRGRLTLNGKSGEAVKRYLDATPSTNKDGVNHILSKSITLARFECKPMVVQRHSPIQFEVRLDVLSDELISDLALLIHAPGGERASLIDLRSPNGPYRLAKGTQLLVRAEVPSVPFVENDYAVGIYLNADSIHHSFMNLLTFSVLPEEAKTGVVPRDAQFRGLVELRANVKGEITGIGNVSWFQQPVDRT